MAYAQIDLSDYISDFDDDELITELEARGYSVSSEHNLTETAWCVRNGNLKEALIWLERDFPELKGIADLAN